jgi:hypothetical protein
MHAKLLSTLADAGRLMAESKQLAAHGLNASSILTVIMMQALML